MKLTEKIDMRGGLERLIEVLEVRRGAIRAGAKGVVYGRNTWQADDPARISASVREVVHGIHARGSGVGVFAIDLSRKHGS